MKYFCKLILVAFIKSIIQIIFIFWDRRINVIFVHLGEAREVLADGETDDPGLEHAADECRQRLVAAGLDERSAVQDDDAVGCRTCTWERVIPRAAASRCSARRSRG